MTSVTHSSLRAAKFDPEEIRRIAARAKKAGLLKGAGEPTAIAKNGKPVAAEAGLRSLWMDVTPEMAKTWLGNNFRNRPLSDDTIVAYARDMTNGTWVPTHQGVAFNDRDELIDGQHRLHAIVRCGLTIRMMVTFGLPSAIAGKEMTTMDAVDRGRTRSVADQLKIQHGLKDGSAIAGICHMLGGLCYGQRTRRLSVGQTLEIYRAFEDAVTWIIIHRSKEHGLRVTGVLAAFAFALKTEDGFFGGATPIAQLYDVLMTGESRRPCSSIELLREFLLSDDAKLLNKGTDRGVAELVLQAIHLARSGKAIAKLEPGLAGIEHFRGLQKQRVEKIAAIFRLPDASGKGSK